MMLTFYAKFSVLIVAISAISQLQHQHICCTKDILNLSYLSYLSPPTLL